MAKMDKPKDGFAPVDEVVKKEKALGKLRLDYWPDEATDGVNDQDEERKLELLFESDGKDRAYWWPEPGQALFGHYLAAIVVKMPTFDDKSKFEARTFIVIEVTAPPGLPEGEDYAVRCKHPGAKDPVLKRSGDVVHVGMSKMLEQLLLCGGLPTQAFVGIQLIGVKPLASDARKKLKTFNVRIYRTGRPSNREHPDAFLRLFSTVDQSLYILRYMLNRPLTPEMEVLAYQQHPDKDSVEPPVLIAATAPESARLALAAGQANSDSGTQAEKQQ